MTDDEDRSQTKSATQGVAALVEREVQDAFSRALKNLKGTFSFERKVNLGNYESATYACFVQFDYDPAASKLEWLDAARVAADECKAFVYEQAGIDAAPDEGGIIREVLDAFPGAVVEPSRPAPAPQDADATAVRPYDDAQLDALSSYPVMLKAAKAANGKWARERYATHPQEFYDNRAKKADPEQPEWHERRPDFTHKTTREGVWQK